MATFCQFMATMEAKYMKKKKGQEFWHDVMGYAIRVWHNWFSGDGFGVQGKVSQGVILNHSKS